MTSGPPQTAGTAPDFTHPDEVDAEERARLADDVEFGAAERLTFFSDAVIAIAMTLLALELPVPEGDTAREVLHGLGEGLGEYWVFLISFLVISTHWRTHHQVFRYVNRVDRSIIALNMAWLFLIVITPWSAKLLGSGHINAVRFCQYAGIETVQYGLLAIMIRVLMRSDMLRPGTDLNRLREARWRVLPVLLGFGLSIPVYGLIRLAGLSPYWGYASWAVLPSLVGVVGRRVRTARARRSGSDPAGGAR